MEQEKIVITFDDLELLNQNISEELKQPIKMFLPLLFDKLEILCQNEKATYKNKHKYYIKFIYNYIFDPLENLFNELIDKKDLFADWLSNDGNDIFILQIGKILGLIESSSNIRKFKENYNRLGLPILLVNKEN